MIKAILFLSIFIFMPAQTTHLDLEALDLTVLFETLDLPSYLFITRSLYPLLKEFPYRFDVALHPFGNSAYIGNDTFICEHGISECRGNRMLTCGIFLSKNRNTQYKFADCFMKKFFIEKQSEYVSAEFCANNTDANMNLISKCYSSRQGTTLQRSLENYAKKYIYVKGYTSMPVVVVEGIYATYIQEKFRLYFREYMCKMMNLNCFTCGSFTEET